MMLDYPAFVSICSALHRWTMTKNVVNKPPHRPGSLKCPDDFCVVYSASSRGEFNGKITFRKFRQNLRPACSKDERDLIVMWLVTPHIYSNLHSFTDDFRWLIPAPPFRNSKATTCSTGKACVRKWGAESWWFWCWKPSRFHELNS